MPVHGIDDGNNKKDVYTTEEVLSILQQAIDSGTLQGIDPTQTPIVAAVRESHNNSDVTFWSGTEAEFNELTGVTSELVGARIGSDGKLYLLTGDTTLSDTVEAARQAALEATEGMKREVISVTLLANGWSNTAPYTQTVAVAGMTADKDFLAPYVVPTGNESDDIAAQVALSCISGGSTDTDSVTFYCYDEKPTTTITVFMVDKGTKIESGDYPIASKSAPGIMKVGDGLNVDDYGEVSVAAIEQSGYFFDNVAAMVSFNLAEGDTAITAGYYSVNDGGGALYKIVSSGATANGGTIIALENELKAQLICEKKSINVKQFGAKGDGETDDTEALQLALNEGMPINCPSSQTFLITDNLTLKDTDINLNGSVIKSTAGNNLVVSSNSKFVNITNGELYGVGVLDTTNNKVDYYIDNIYMHDTDRYGLQIGTCGKVTVSNSKFYEIGKGNSVNINSEACGIRINGADCAGVTNNYFEKCHGTGACVIRGVSKYDVSHNIFYKNDYRGIATSSQEGEICSGVISYNNIQECGTYAAHNTGIGCNGIYSNDYGNIEDTVVSNNYIKNVCENGIEGAFGVVSNNTIINTGVDQTNHPTPSACGINMYGKKYIGNTVINPYLAAYYVSGNTHSESTDLSNKIIKDNFAGVSAHTPSVAIFVNGTTYTNINIRNNLMEGGLQLAPAATYTNCSISNNTNKNGDKYYNVNYLPAIDSSNGVVKFNKFNISGTTITNVTTASSSYSIDTDYVEFTSTGTNGAFAITCDCSTDALNTLIIKTDKDDFKVTATGVNDDDTTTTIAYQRTIVSNASGVSGFTTKTKNYKQIKYTIFVGASASTMKVYNIKAKEIFDLA